MALTRLARLSVDIIVNAQRANRQIKNVEKNLKRVQSQQAAFNRRMAMGGAIIGVYAVVAAFRATIGAIKETTLAFAKFERQLIDVGKIAGISDLNRLNEMFKSLRVQVQGFSMEEISKTASAAARAGFGDLTEIEELTKIALRFQAASGDISGQEAALGLARLGKNLGLTIPQVGELAATIDVLSDNFSVSSGEILKSTQRLSGFSEAAGISGERMAAFAAALLSSGQTPTVVRSTTIRLIQQLAKDTLGAGKALGMTNEEAQKFALTFRVDVIDALRLFADASSKLTLVELTDAFSKIGLSTARTSSTLAILAKGLEAFDKAQEIAASNDNLLTHINKANIVFNSTHAELVELANKWEEFKASIADSDRVIHVLETMLILFERMADAVGTERSIGQDDEIVNIESIEDITAAIEELDAQIDAAKENMRAEDNILIRLLKTWVDPSHWATSGWASAGSEADLQRLIDQQKRLVEIQGELLEGKAAQTDLDLAALAVAQDKRDAAKAQLEAEQEIDRLKVVTDLGTSLKPAVSRDETLEQRFARIMADAYKKYEEAWADIQLLGGGDSGTHLAELKQTWEAWKEAHIANRDSAIAERDAREANTAAMEEETRKRKQLSGEQGFLGPFGRIMNILAQRDAAIGEQERPPEFVNALDNVVMAQINALFSQGGRRQGFTGLTEAWKQAQEKTEDNPLLRLQVELLKQWLKQNAGEKVGERLQLILNQLRQGGVVEIQ